LGTRHEWRYTSLVTQPPITEITVLEAKSSDLGGFVVKRALPTAKRRRVGPFVFLDQMGPVHMPEGHGLDVRPHPHIGLATVTYLFEGQIDHRDSLGTHQSIAPGDINWMVAGRGIVHSERSDEASRSAGAKLFGIQSWVALPTAEEERAPSFVHHARSTIPRVSAPGATLDVLLGTAYGARSPVEVLSKTLYVHAALEAGATLPLDDEHEERAVYVVEGAVQVGGVDVAPGCLAVVPPSAVTLTCSTEARLMLLGGAPLEGERHIDWNFVSSDRARLTRAKEEWIAGRFPAVPGDAERIPHPEENKPR